MISLLLLALPRQVALIPPAQVEWIAEGVERAARALGLRPVRLSPEEFVNPKVFNPRNFPVAVYTGAERYLRTVRSPGDGEEALLRYLSRGGTLVVAGQCWPFYAALDRRDRRFERAAITVFSGRLELFISGPGTTGFERPPEEITFEARPQPYIEGVPPKFLFPSSGDLRYRPVSGEGLPPEDEFVPVVVAVGRSGKVYGPGMAVILHRCRRFEGAKVIYVWHGLWGAIPDLAEK